MIRFLTYLLWPSIALLSAALLGQSQGASSLPKEELLKTSGIYLDSIFQDYANARTKLCPDFRKRSRTAVVYMCYERSSLIDTALSALLKSSGIQEFDLIVSQDGGASFKAELPFQVKGLNHVIIRHEHNLYPGQHQHFVKKFVFDVFGYEYVIVVEEDNAVHPDALKFLEHMLMASEDDRTVGLASIQDMDNSVLFNETRYASSYLRVGVDKGHLRVYGLHRSRYSAIASQLQAYYDLIKGRDYSTINLPQMSEALKRLYKTKLGLEAQELLQDAYLLNLLHKAGYSHRLTSMVRLFRPIGFQGLQSREDTTDFLSVWGHGMYEGQLLGQPRQMSPAEQQVVAAEAEARVTRLYEYYLGRPCSPVVAHVISNKLLAAKLNMVEIVTKMRTGAEQQTHIKSVVQAD